MTYKLFIGIMIASILAVSVTNAEASIATRSVKHFVDQTCDVLWNNIGTIAATLALVTVAANPAPFVEGTTTIITGTTIKSVIQQTSLAVSFIVCLTLAVFAVVGGRSLINYIKDWFKILPFLVVGVLLLSCGIAEAGVMECFQHGGIIKPPWWDVIGIIIFILTMFM
jgi:hypothetical protein